MKLCSNPQCLNLVLNLNLKELEIQFNWIALRRLQYQNLRATNSMSTFTIQYYIDKRTEAKFREGER